jgi:hypothetical protein
LRAQFHFHTPSEHSINGVHYPLEMHMVHKLFQASSINTTIVPANTAGAYLARAAVIGIMFAYECVLALLHCALRLTDSPGFAARLATTALSWASWRPCSSR